MIRKLPLRLLVDALGLALIVVMVAVLAGAWAWGAAGLGALVLNAFYSPEGAPR